MKSMAGILNRIVGQASGTSRFVASGSNEINLSTQKLSESVTEQVSSVEEISPSVEEMGAAIDENTENAMETRRISQKAANDAAKGGKAVGE